MTDDLPEPASPPCHLATQGPDGPDPAQDLAGWRKAQRSRLLAARQALTVAARQTIASALCRHVADLIADRCPDLRGVTASAFWPIKGEPDLRPLLADWHAAGALAALPVVEVRHAPLVFRRWTPETRMIRGDWNIPVPGPGAAAVVPQIALAPLVGWDTAGYRLGYGGGYFDRTLAALSPRPFVIGVGFQAARIETIYPQPHDIPLDAIVTEAGLQVLRG
jgi:5,10-methenyltetrahydrofolate synthetase